MEKYCQTELQFHVYSYRTGGLNQLKESSVNRELKGEGSILRPSREISLPQNGKNTQRLCDRRTVKEGLSTGGKSAKGARGTANDPTRSQQVHIIFPHHKGSACACDLNRFSQKDSRKFYGINQKRGRGQCSHVADRERRRNGGIQKREMERKGVLVTLSITVIRCIALEYSIGQAPSSRESFFFSSHHFPLLLETKAPKNKSTEGSRARDKGRQEGAQITFCWRILSSAFLPPDSPSAQFQSKGRPPSRS